MSKLFQKEWDYTNHAKFYEFRPNYADSAIDALVAWSKDAKLVADIGAGTANLGIMLAARGLNVIEIEPNDAMSTIGKTKLPQAKWIKTSGANTTLENKSVDWVTFGSSFGVFGRKEGLTESYRILKDNGKLSILYNHRNLSEPIQQLAQEILKSFIPAYNGGTRREDQRLFLEENNNLFGEIFYLEQDFYFKQTIENYILAWKSVKNTFWDLGTKEGVELFDKICDKWRKELPNEFNIPYTTRIWSATKK